MKRTEMHVTCVAHASVVKAGRFGDTLVPFQIQGSLVQLHYLIPAAASQAYSFCVDMAPVQEIWKQDFEQYRDGLTIDRDQFPYAFSERAWWQYCLTPHSYLDLGGGCVQVGLNFANRFLHLDLHRRTAHLVDPEIGGEILSTTNWYDHETGVLWFASWPGRDTVHRMRSPHAQVQTTIWKLSVRGGQIERFWQGYLGDALHQLAMSPDRRFLLLTELGLRTEAPMPAGSPQAAPGAWARGLVPSTILVRAVQTQAEWRLPMATAGHVEFDPQQPDIGYLSGHNIGLIGGKVAIFGPACLQKVHLTAAGPVILGEFTHPRFHRITTHAVFRHRGRTVIAVAGYPARLFLLAAATMTLIKALEINPGETVDTRQSPHRCLQDSYGMIPSSDGDTLLVCWPGEVRLVDIASGRVDPSCIVDGYDAKATLAGHLKTYVPDRAPGHRC